MEAKDVAFSSSRLLTREFAILVKMPSIALQRSITMKESYSPKLCWTRHDPVSGTVSGSKHRFCIHSCKPLCFDMTFRGGDRFVCTLSFGIENWQKAIAFICEERWVSVTLRAGQISCIGKQEAIQGAVFRLQGS